MVETGRQLLRCLASAEALIDFGEEEGITDDVAAEVLGRVRALRSYLERHIRGGRSAPGMLPSA